MKQGYLAVVILEALLVLAAGHSANHNANDAYHTKGVMPAHNQYQAKNTSPVGLQLEFENESVQVVRITIAPHQRVPLHEVTPRVVVFLTDEDLRLTFPNGEMREEHHRAGDTLWLPAQKHAGENLSERPIEFIAVIPKEK